MEIPNSVKTRSTLFPPPAPPFIHSFPSSLFTPELSSPESDPTSTIISPLRLHESASAGYQEDGLPDIESSSLLLPENLFVRESASLPELGGQLDEFFEQVRGLGTNLHFE